MTTILPRRRRSPMRCGIMTSWRATRPGSRSSETPTQTIRKNKEGENWEGGGMEKKETKANSNKQRIRLKNPFIWHKPREMFWVFVSVIRKTLGHPDHHWQHFVNTYSKSKLGDESIRIVAFLWSPWFDAFEVSYKGKGVALLSFYSLSRAYTRPKRIMSGRQVSFRGKRFLYLSLGIIRVRVYLS